MKSQEILQKIKELEETLESPYFNRRSDLMDELRDLKKQL